ncbi:hypothetical protein CSOJ01_14046 [Colletotrichum sojae]|uniref:Uncharacterized protein n=1 Tax=Colletotrichum sojae TaxID=2175907 RepID=A0A8H6IRI3_9PEZI|nr:hypothetical protein CSOJ01_14046 [Colletotrichum sojae]
MASQTSSMVVETGSYNSGSTGQTTSDQSSREERERNFLADTGDNLYDRLSGGGSGDGQHRTQTLEEKLGQQDWANIPK